jgi:hypothetical protein
MLSRSILQRHGAFSAADDDEGLQIWRVAEDTRRGYKVSGIILLQASYLYT